MKVYLIKSTACYHYSGLGFVFSIVDEKQLMILKDLLPWYQILGEKELKDLPILDEEILDNYRRLFFSQPEIRKNKLRDDPNYMWYKYTNEVDEIFYNRKSVQNQIKDAVTSTFGDWKEYIFKKLVIEISKQGYDDSGSFLYSELEDKLGALRTLCLTSDKILETDWRDVYDNRSILLEQVCPSYAQFLSIVQNVFGFINVEISDSGTTSEYIPDTDKYSTTENVRLKNIVDSTRTYRDKMGKICKVLLDETNNLELNDLVWLPRDFRKPLEILGPERIRALGYHKFKVENELMNVEAEILIYNEMKKMFKVGEKYPHWYVTEVLKKLFKEYNYQKPPLAATHMRKVFYTSRCKMKTRDGKECRGFKIIGYKEKLGD